MISFQVDKKKCDKDGICVEVCPIKIVRMNEKERVPEFVDGGGDICINCGHCFSACPHGAITLSTMSPDNSIPLDPAKLPNAEQVELFLKGRRSIRVYKLEPVKKELVEKLLDIARYAPSGINRQPVNWLVVMGNDKVRELVAAVVGWMEGLLENNSPLAQSLRFERLVQSWKKGNDMICRGAPCVIVAYGLKDDPMVPQSCTIAGEYLELAAFGLGLGACWGGYVAMALAMSEEVRKSVGLSSRAFAGAAMMIGYPKYRYPRIPARNPLKILWK
jgi:nitroreductase/NAD-dependent dihydropyrimidine dehydrogenase PreA subunit